MTRLLSTLMLGLVCCNAALAHDNFVTNPHLAYPPGCAGDPGRSAVPFVQGRDISLLAYSTARIDARLDGWRSTCSESGRSLIWLRLTVARPAETTLLYMPWVGARTGDLNWYAQRLATTPNGWGLVGDSSRDQQFLVLEPDGLDNSTEQSWTFLLDGVVQDGIEGWWNVYDFPSLSANQYNQPFTLRLDTSWTRYEIEVPATDAQLHTEPGMPLNGRLSGLWAIDGAADQGLTLTIADRVAPADTPATPRGEGPLVLILQQYSFDASGNLLWLTGSADFEQGAREVTLPIVRVADGQFLGGPATQRDIVGSVRIVANGCNDLEYEYDLSSLGLGSGSRKLRRLFSLETAGYDCRDYAAKVAANQ